MAHSNLFSAVQKQIPLSTAAVRAPPGLMRWLLWIHACYAVAHLAAASLTREWNPIDTLQPIRERDPSEANKRVVLPPPPPYRRMGRLPFHHVRNRPALIVHALCLALAFMACVRVEPQAEREFNDMVTPHYNALFTPAGSRHTRRGSAHSVTDLRAPRDAEDLVPRQRGGKRTVQEIMEMDVAHLIKNKKQTGEQPEPANAAVAPSSLPVVPVPERPLTDFDDGSALVALLFHSIGLLLALAHQIFFSGWSWIDPRAASRLAAPATHGLPRGVAHHFLATTATAYLQLASQFVALYCIMRAGTDADPPRETDHAARAGGGAADGQRLDDITPNGLLSGLLFLPYFLLHAHRFLTNHLLWWRFKIFFPRIGFIVRAKRNPSAQEDGDDAAVGGSAVARRIQKARAEREASAAAAAAAAADAGASSSDAGSEDDEDDGVDLAELRELAAFAPDSSAAASSSSAANEAGDAASLAPSAYMQKLRDTPKIQQLLAEQQRAKKQAKEQTKLQTRKTQ